jgi:predicted transcriptional regulator
MSYGYSQSLVYANKKANIKSLGVALGRVCILEGVSVSHVADFFGVSRMAVYNWFKGESVPHPDTHAAIEKYMRSIKSRHNKQK